MKIAITSGGDPYLNLATEEVLLRDESIDEDLLLIYVNKNTIVVGRNQNVHQEINHHYVAEKRIKLIRRVSGGGAVFHDQGNVNFSFITDKDHQSYQKFLEPIIAFLNSLGLKAEFKGKNDLEVNGFKVSGNAQFLHKKRMFHHGTLLFDADLTKLSSALKPNLLKMQSKGIKSTQARVANIKSLLKEDLSVEQFIQKLIEFFKQKNGGKMFELSSYKKAEIKEIANRLESKEWTYGQNPNFAFQSVKRFVGGTIDLKLNSQNNKITALKFYGDFLSKVQTEDVEKYFIGRNFSHLEIGQAIDEIVDFDHYFGKLTREDILELFFN